MANCKRPENGEITEALEESYGIILAAANKLGVHRSTLHRWIAEDANLQEAKKDAIESALDKAEGKLFELIEQGELKAIMYFLDRRGRDRGYGLKPEKVSLDFEPVQLVLPDDGRGPIEDCIGI